MRRVCQASPSGPAREPQTQRPHSVRWLPHCPAPATTGCGRRDSDTSCLSLVAGTQEALRHCVLNAWVCPSQWHQPPGHAGAPFTSWSTRRIPVAEVSPGPKPMHHPLCHALALLHSSSPCRWRLWGPSLQTPTPFPGRTPPFRTFLVGCHFPVCRPHSAVN